MFNPASRFAAITAIMVGVLPAQADPYPAPDARRWSSWVEFGGSAGTDGSSRGEAAAFVPFWQTWDALGFVELRGKLFEENQKEINAALGYRRMLDNGWNAGIWGGFDLRASNSGNIYPQLAGGVEMLHPDFDFRLNGYLPLKTANTLSSSTTTTTTFTGSQTPTLRLTGNQLLMVSGGQLTTTTTTTRMRELAMWGVDAEVGIRVPIEHLIGGAEGARHELRVAAGGFHFDHSDLPGSVSGPKTRAEWRIMDVLPDVPGSRLTLETEYSYDRARRHRWEAGLRLRLPLGSRRKDASGRRPLSAQELRMVEALERDTDIVTGDQQSSNATTVVTGDAEMVEPVNDAETGAELDRVAHANDAASLAAAVAQGENTLIIVSDNGTPIDLTGTEGIALMNNQTVLGDGGTLPVRGRISGNELVFSRTGPQPTLRSTHDNINRGVVILGSNSHVTGVAITGTTVGSNTALLVPANVSNALANRNTISNTGFAVFTPGSTTDLVFSDNSVSNSRIVGFFNSDNRNTRIERNTYTDVVRVNVILSFLDDNDGISFVDNVIDNSGHTSVGSISFSRNNQNIDFRGNRITVGGFQGEVFVVGPNNTIAVNDNTFIGGYDFSGGQIVRLNHPGNTLSGSGNQATVTYTTGAFQNCAVTGIQTGSFSMTVTGGPMPGVITCP